MRIVKASLLLLVFGLLGMTGTPVVTASDIQWTVQFGSPSGDGAFGVSVDSSGAYVAGFTGGVLPGQTSAGLTDAFVRKYDLNGIELWTRQFGSSSHDDSYAVSADSSGVYLVGVAGGPLPGQTGAGLEDAFVAKFSPDPNNPPVLSPIGDRTVVEDETLTFIVTATDPDTGQTLTFSLVDAPDGASINPSAGVFSWSPTEAQGPGSYMITIVVTDSGSPALSDSETIQATVNEVNRAPVLAPIGAKTVDEQTLLSFTATATDPDIPANVLTFSLDASAPPGASINPSTGVFTWTPAEAEGPGTYTLSITASDGLASDFEDILITVKEAYSAPVLGAVGARTVNQGVLLSFTVTATDPDVPVQSLVFSLGSNAPTGASITPTGVFSWAPSEAQGPGSYTATIIVFDGTLTDSETITITVNEVQRAPPAPAPWWSQFWYLVLIGALAVAGSAVFAWRKLLGQERLGPKP